MIEKRIIFSAAAVIIVVGLIIGLLVEIQKNSSNELGYGDDVVLISRRDNALSALCNKTDDEKFCHRVLDSVNSTDPKDYIKAAVQGTLDQVIRLSNTSDLLALQAKRTPRTKMAIEDCKILLQYAKDELQPIITLVDGSDDVQGRSYEFKVWLSAVVSYQQSCIDAFGEDGKIDQKFLKVMIKNGLLDVGKLTDLALAVIDELPASFSFEAIDKPASHSRRLLEIENDHDYPTWFSASSRDLLAMDGINGGKSRPNAVVAKDGSGQFHTINDALAAIPLNRVVRYEIYVKAGIYHENVIVSHVNVTMYGDGPDKTIVTGNRSKKTGWTTLLSSTFSVEASGFIAKDMGFQNTAGADQGQAVALRVKGDMSAFFNCRMDGYQDTLWVQADRQFYRDCVISGTIDFIFGDSVAFIQNSHIIVRRPADKQYNVVTAQGRKYPREPTAIVIHSSKVVAEDRLIHEKLQFKSYLGRPWKDSASTVIMESELGGFLEPEGWTPWNEKTPPSDLLFYAEYANTGPGAAVHGRVNWKGFHVIDKATAQKFAPCLFLEQSGIWLKETGVPIQYELKN